MQQRRMFGMGVAMKTNEVSYVRRMQSGLGSALFVMACAMAAPTTNAAEVVTYYYTGPQGTVLATTDASGNVISTSDYRPYGSQSLGLSHEGPGYAGHFSDIDSGLIYMQARYYDPSLGRFLSVDPKSGRAGDAYAFGSYSYANGNPVVNIDPDGKRSIVADGKVYIRPEDKSVPIPGPFLNNVGGRGVSPSDFSFHTYNVVTPQPTHTFRSRAGHPLQPNPGP